MRAPFLSGVVFLLLSLLGGSACAAPVALSPQAAHLLESRKLIATLPFPHNDYKLTPQLSAELERQFRAALVKSGERGIIRLEGFATAGETVGPTGVALLRAREAWNHLSKKYRKARDRMFMTWYEDEQALSSAQQGRLEIAVYENPFSAELEQMVKAKEIR